MYWRKSRLLQGAVMSLAVVGSVSLGMRIANADHQFLDVPTSHPFHNFVEWLVNRGVTAGCGGGNYCPDSPVTRGQMAVFMKGLGVVATPTILHSELSPGALDLDISPTVCATGDHTPAYPQQAVVHARATVSAAAAGVLHATVFAVYSTNGGTTWTPLSGNTDRVYTTLAGEWSSANDVDQLDLNPGTAYRFGVQFLRQAGTVDASSSRCEVFAQVLNRNPTTPPFLTERGEELTPDTSKE